ncbi:hypothetical protein GCM10010404_38130 [Nonomuraea africana]
MNATYISDATPSHAKVRCGTPSTASDNRRRGGADSALTHTMKRSESGGAALRWMTVPRPQEAAAPTHIRKAPNGPPAPKS